MLKRFVVGLMCATILITTGCWDYAPLEQKYAISGVAIDRGTLPEHAFSLSTLGISYDSESEMVHAQGQSISDALRRIQDQAGKIVAISHLQVILISEEVAKEGLMNLLDLFIRDVQIRDDAFLMVVKGKAEEYFKEANFSDQLSGEMFQNAVQFSETQLNTAKFQMHDVISELSNGSIDLVLPYLRIDRAQKGLVWDGLAVFRNAQMVLKLDTKEAMAFGLLAGMLRRAEYTTQLDRSSMPIERYSARFVINHRNVEWSVRDDQLHVDFEFELEDQLVEINPWESKPIDQAKKIKIETVIAEQINRSLKDVFIKIQKIKSEPFDFQQMIRLKDPFFNFETYRQRFSEASFDVRTEMKLNEMGHLY